MRHTPGPWTCKKALTPVDGAFDYAIAAEVDGRPQVIAEAFARSGQTSFPPAEANARLIAAAPDLLEALKKANWLIGKLAGWNGTDISDLDELGYPTILAAIAKAEEATQ